MGEDEDETHHVQHREDDLQPLLEMGQRPVQCLVLAFVSAFLSSEARAQRLAPRFRPHLRFLDAERITALDTELAKRLDAARHHAEQAEAELRVGPGPKEREHQEQLVVLEQRVELARQVDAANTQIRDLEMQRQQARVQEIPAQRQAEWAP